jgi:general secretion pathway protein G
VKSVRIDKLRSVVRDRVSSGFTLFELVVTLAVLSVLVVGTIPLTQNANKRQKEMRLRETLRQVRAAIDEFKRDTYGACPQGAIMTGNPIGRPGTPNAPSDPRSRVVIDDCTIFDTENLDRFPPDLETLVNGVRVKPRGINLMSGRGLGGDDLNATDINSDEEIIKVYLRDLPVDPMTGESNWELRSSYQDADSSWDQINVFDVRSASDEEGLNGEKYSDW